MRSIVFACSLAAIAALGSLSADDTPHALMGTWGAGQVASTSFVNRATGSYSEPSGTQVQYRFLPGGRYEYSSLTTQSTYSCTTRFMTFRTGVVAYRGDQLTFIPESGKFTSRDTCTVRNNYEKAAGIDRETYRWRVERDQSGTKMCLQNGTVDGCAYRW